MKTATLERYHIYGTPRHNLRVTYRGQTLRWLDNADAPTRVHAEWLDQSQDADIDNARAVARRFAFTHLRVVGDWDRRTKPKGGRL